MADNVFIITLFECVYVCVGAVTYGDIQRLNVIHALISTVSRRLIAFSQLVCFQQGMTDDMRVREVNKQVPSCVSHS